MAEGFGAYYHVPQHGRREKLRVADSVRRDYDPSNLMTKPEAVNLMGFDSVQEMSTFVNFEVGRSEFDAHEVFVFMPEPLSLSLSSNNLGGVDNAVGVEGDVARSSVPLGPFTGYATVLRGSRFLEPARMLLEEFCGDVGPAGFAAADMVVEDFKPEIGGGGGENQRKKYTLISMLDEVYKRYKQYYQQMQEIVTSFESVAGLGNAAPYTNIALKTMSKHFKSLRDAISDQLKFTNKCQLGHGKNEAGKPDIGFYSQRGVNNSNSGCFENQPVWRPQRGLPERAVAVLREWLFEHFLHPYPTDTDKLMLAKQTGLSRCQVSNWFINARVRLWKPMVEEIHMLETRQAQKDPQRNGAGNNDNNSDERPNKYSKSANTVARGGGTVSLTLGLHQNNCMSSSEPFPMHSPQRFGLGADGNGDGYVMGGFQAQQRHFGREAAGGQLLHDFVG